MYDPKVLAITDEDLLGAVSAGIANVAALSLAANYPTLASIPHSVINGYKNVLSIALATEYSFPRCARAEPIDSVACCAALLFCPAVWGASRLQVLRSCFHPVTTHITNCICPVRLCV